MVFGPNVGGRGGVVQKRKENDVRRDADGSQLTEPVNKVVGMNSLENPPTVQVRPPWIFSGLPGFLTWFSQLQPPVVHDRRHSLCLSSISSVVGFSKPILRSGSAETWFPAEGDRDSCAPGCRTCLQGSIGAEVGRTRWVQRWKSRFRFSRSGKASYEDGSQSGGAVDDRPADGG